LYPIKVRAGEESDKFTFPAVLMIASLGFHDYVVQQITWVSGVHDVACKHKAYTPEIRVDIFRECIWLAFRELNQKLAKSSDSILMRSTRKSLAWLRGHILVKGVSVGSLFGSC
jgi:hypothetical protein